MSLPAAIRRHRTRNLMTQAEYANHLKVSTSAVMGWEQGVRTPSLAMARKLIDKGVDKAVVLAAVTSRAEDAAA